MMVAAEEYDRNIRKNCRDALDRASAEGKVPANTHTYTYKHTNTHTLTHNTHMCIHVYIHAMYCRATYFQG